MCIKVVGRSGAQSPRRSSPSEDELSFGRIKVLYACEIFLESRDCAVHVGASAVSFLSILYSRIYRQFLRCSFKQMTFYNFSENSHIMLFCIPSYSAIIAHLKKIIILYNFLYG